MAKYYEHLKNCELNRFRKFLRDHGDTTEYSNRAIIFLMAKHAGRVQSVPWRQLKWGDTLMMEHQQGVLTMYKKTDTSNWEYWNFRNVLYLPNIDLWKEEA